jgi:hypothetical protein
MLKRKKPHRNTAWEKPKTMYLCGILNGLNTLKVLFYNVTKCTNARDRDKDLIATL